MAGWRSRVFAVLALSTAASAQAADPLAVLIPAIVEPGIPVDAEVMSKCTVELDVAVFAYQRIERRFRDAIQVQSVEQAGSGKVVKLTILKIGIHNPYKGAYNLSQDMTVRADVLQNSQVIASQVFELNNLSGHAYTPGVVVPILNTCRYVTSAGEQLGRDVGRWLRKVLEQAKQ